MHVFQKLFGPDKPMMSTTYAYDQKGRRIERHMRMGDLGGHRTTFRYDDSDNAIEETTVDTTREMQIDNEGNLRSAKETTHTQLARLDREDIAFRWNPSCSCLRRTCFPTTSSEIGTTVWSPQQLFHDA